MKIRIHIALKRNVLDTQGKAIESAITKDLGFYQISNIRQGKFIDLEINETNQENIKEIISKICDKLLVNKVIEDYSFEIL